MCDTVVREGFLEEEEMTSKPQSEVSVGVGGWEKEKQQKQRDCFEDFRNCIIILKVFRQTFST